MIEIKARGGTAVVQDPLDAFTPNMPGQSITSNTSGVTSACNCFSVNGGFLSNTAQVRSRPANKP